MGIVPEKKNQRVAFYASKVDVWAVDPPAIGTTPGVVAELADRVAAARAALVAADTARDAARGATLAADLAIGALGELGASIIGQIRARAAVAGEAIYALASIPAPAARGPLPPPGTPYDLKVTLRPDGALVLKWRCPNPRGAEGTMYHVARRLGGGGAPGPFVPLGSAGTRAFTDATVPAGAAAVAYRVTAARSTGAGDAAEFVVNLSGPGAAAAGAAAAGAAKLAA